MSNVLQCHCMSNMSGVTTYLNWNTNVALAHIKTIHTLIDQYSRYIPNDVHNKIRYHVTQARLYLGELD